MKLSIRDQFACSAMNAIIGSDAHMDVCSELTDRMDGEEPEFNIQDAIAMSAYAIADAMMKHSGNQ